MAKSTRLCLALMLLASTGNGATIMKLRDHRRVLLVSAPSPSDPQLAAQRNMLAGWRQGAADRDLIEIELVAARVIGSDDSATALRTRYALPSTRFEALLIGKDGHVARRSSTPLAAKTLEATIDAMPMRQAGER